MWRIVSPSRVLLSRLTKRLPSSLASFRRPFCSPSVSSLSRVERVDPGSANIYEIAGGSQFKLQALVQQAASLDTWVVAWRASHSDPWQTGQMQATDKENTFTLRLSNNEAREMMFEDDLLALAAFDSDLPFGSDSRLDPAGPRGENIMSYFPRWPSSVLRKLSKTTLHGSGVVIFDSELFYDYLYLSAFPYPIIFPHGAYKLQLKLGDVTKMVNSSVAHCSSVREVFGSDYARKSVLPFLSGGRLMGLSDERFAQLGSDFFSAFEQTLSQPVTLTFTSANLGLGMGPVDMGTGAVVTSVDGQAEQLGVKEGWRLLEVNGRNVQREDFWTIDGLFDLPPPWKITFSTDSDVSHLYGVELPTQEILPAFKAFPSSSLSSADLLSSISPASASSSSFSSLSSSTSPSSPSSSSPSSPSSGCGSGGCNNCSCKKSPIAFAEPGLEIQSRSPLGPFIWQEPFSRLFVGDPGSATCVHSDLMPQIEICHMLSGVKVVGVAPWAETPGLLTEYGQGSPVASAEADDKHTYIPAHRKLSPQEKHLLTNPAVSLLLARPGDLLAFSSACAHFATNGLREISTSLYHGGLTPASIPRLCADPKTLTPFSAAERQGEYQDHVTGEDLIQEYGRSGSIAVARQLRHKLKKQGGTVFRTEAARLRYEDCIRAMEAALVAAKQRRSPSSWLPEHDIHAI